MQTPTINKQKSHTRLFAGIGVALVVVIVAVVAVLMLSAGGGSADDATADAYVEQCTGVYDQVEASLTTLAAWVNGEGPTDDDALAAIASLKQQSATVQQMAPPPAFVSSHDYLVTALANYALAGDLIASAIKTHDASGQAIILKAVNDGNAALQSSIEEMPGR